MQSLQSPTCFLSSLSHQSTPHTLSILDSGLFNLVKYIKNMLNLSLGSLLFVSCLPEPCQHLTFCLWCCLVSFAAVQQYIVSDVNGGANSETMPKRGNCIEPVHLSTYFLNPPIFSQSTHLMIFSQPTHLMILAEGRCALDQPGKPLH